MSALAVFLKDLGNEVVGSDVSEYYFTVDKLNEKEIKFYEYNKDNITNDYIYIIGHSITKQNVEFKEILDRDLEYYYYNNFIAEFIDKKMIAVSGTHGKTTTCHLIKELSDVSYIIGCGDGYANSSEYFVLEACEYQNHFLSYEPDLLIINNLDFDHPDFFKTKKDVINSYQKIANNSKKVLINGDDINAKKIIHSRKITFGMNNNNDYLIKIIKTNESGYTFLLKGRSICRLLKCSLLGIHNLYNYTAAYLACIICGLKVNNFKEITYPKRRMKVYKFGESILIDDYAHHPTEIKSLLETIKLTYPNYLINTFFQSHTYSRTLKFKKDFKKVLKKFNKVYMLDVFTSKREPYDKMLQKKVDRYFRKFKKYHNSDLFDVKKEEKTVWVFLGAGVANTLIDEIMTINLDNENK